MAGHSQFKNIMVRKGAQDAKRAKVFTKIIREIIAACKTGMADPTMNPRLRTAIAKAKAESLPRDKIEAAIKRGSGEVGGENFEEIRYEGYGPGGIALIVEALTDNRNRTASELRSNFTKQGGNLGETGSVSFMFDRVGLITYDLAVASEEKMLEAAIEAGADNCVTAGQQHDVTCPVEAFNDVRDALEKILGPAKSAKLSWQPKMLTAVNEEEQAKALMKLIDVLEDNDDVQEVFGNFAIPEALMEKLAA